MKFLLLFICLLLLSPFTIRAQHPHAKILERIYTRGTQFNHGQYTITEKHKRLTETDTLLKRKRVFFINTVSSDHTPPYSAKIIDLLGTKTTYIDSNGSEQIYNAADSTILKRTAKMDNQVLSLFQPHVSRTNLFYLKHYPEEMSNVQVEETHQAYVLNISITQDDELLGNTQGDIKIWFNKRTLVPERQVSVVYSSGLNQYTETLISDCDFSPLLSTDITLPGNLPVKSLANKVSSPDTMPVPLQNGSLFPSMQLSLQSGQTYTLAKDSARVYILDFWYISCAPCIQLSKVLVNLQEKYSNKGVRIVGINPYDKADVIQKWIIQRGINYPSVVNAGSFTRSIGLGQSFPVVIILDEKKRIKAVMEGYGPETEQKLEEHIINTLK